MIILYYMPFTILQEMGNCKYRYLCAGLHHAEVFDYAWACLLWRSSLSCFPTELLPSW